MAGDDTRDIAVEARALVDAHMTDCAQFRKDLKETLGEFRADLKTLYWRLALILGGLIVVSKGAEFLFKAVGK